MNWEVLTMKSRTSCFNRGFARDLWRRTWPLWAAYLLALLFLGPLNLLNLLQRPERYYVNGKANFNFLFASGAELVMLVSFAAACLAVMAVFGFLYNSRSCGMVNSFPMTRTETFWTCFLTGLLPLLAADLVAAGLTALFCRGGYLEITTVLFVLGALVLSKLFFYGFAAFCAMLTGSLLVLPLVYILLSFAVYIIELTAGGVLSYVVYGLDMDYAVASLSWPTLLSPPVGMMQRYRVGYVNWPDTISITGLDTLALYALAGCAFALLAWALYRRRKMETAGDTVALPVLRPLFQVSMCFGTAFVFAAVILSLSSNAWRGRAAAFIALGLLLVGAFLGWFAARMVLEKSLRVFRKSWGGFLACALVLTLFLLACEYDLFGYERRVPAFEDVASVSVQGRELKEPENIEAAIALHRGLIVNKAYHESVDGPGVESFSSEGDAWSTVNSLVLNYTLKNGRSLIRYYRVCGDDKTVQDPDSDLRRLHALRNSREAILDQCSLPFELTAERVQWANLQIYDPEPQPGRDVLLENLTLTREEMVDLWENGLQPDAREGHIARKLLPGVPADWSYTNAEVYLMAVEDPEQFERTGGRSELMQYMVFRIASDSAHSLAWIEEHTDVRPVEMGDSSAVLGGVG